MPACKQITDEVVEAKEATGEVVARISTSSRDRYGEHLDAKGWEIEDPYRGPITYNHLGNFTTDTYHRLRVAEPVKVWKDDESLMAHYRYFVDAPGKLGEFARALHYIERTSGMDHSVMFDPLGWSDPDGSSGTRDIGDPLPQMPVNGRHYTRNLLMEFGPVELGANPDAWTVAAKAFRKYGPGDLLTVAEAAAETLPGTQIRMDLSASADGSGAANEFEVAFGAALQKLNQELETRRFFKAVVGGLKNE